MTAPGNQTAPIPATPDQPAVPVPTAAAPPAAPVAPVSASQGPSVLGGELEAALRERAAQAAQNAPTMVWSYAGEDYRLRPTMPAGAIFDVMLAMESDDGGKMLVAVLQSVKSFFQPPDGERFLKAITNPDAAIQIDMQYVEAMIGALFEAYNSRPFDSA